MAKEGFHRDFKAVSRILKTDPALLAAQKAIADDLAEKSGGEVISYVTDRGVWAVKVDAAAQAKDGSLTKAVGSQGKTLS
jgi:hypothetical protein